MAPVAGGSRLTEAERFAVEDAIRAAERESRAEISVYVGATPDDDPRRFARRLHRSLVAPDHSILLLVDPDQRVVEIVSGSAVREHLSDDECAAAVAEMTDLFEAGDLVGGLRLGITHLGEYADAHPALPR